MLKRAASFYGTLDIDKIIIRLMLLFPITTILQGISIFSPINKVLVLILTGFLGLKILDNIVDNFDFDFFTLFVLVMASTFLGIFSTNSINFNINNFFHFPVFEFFAIYFIKNSEYFIEDLKKERKFIFYLIEIWECIVFISIFFPSSYIKSWGNNFYFKSFSEGVPHRFASSAGMIIAMVFVLIKEIKGFNREKLILLSLLVIPAASILMSGARVYLLVLVFSLGAIYYNECKTPKVFWTSIIPIAAIGIILILATPMGSKIFASFNNKDTSNLLESLTSGRSTFWKYDMHAFLTSPIPYQFLGSGAGFVFEVNKQMIGLTIYAHNDFINILMTYGYLGMLEYIIAIQWALTAFFKKKKCISIFSALCILGIYLVTAILNGFYVYPCTVYSIPIFLYCIQKQESHI